MLVPLHLGVAMGHLNVPYARLGEPPRHETLPAEIRGDRVIDPIQRLRGRRFARDIFHPRKLGLHPECEFERIDPRLQRRLRSRLRQMPLIDLPQLRQLGFLHRPRHLGIADVLHPRIDRRDARVADRRPLVGRREKGRAPVVDPAMRERRADRHKRRQVRVLRPEAIRSPRANTRPHEVIAARMQLHHRPAVGRVRAMHRVDHAQVVDMLGDMREQFAHRNPALAVLLELPRRLEQVVRRRELNARLIERQRFAIVPIEQRLGVERIDLRRAALHEHEDHPLRPCRKVRLLRQQRIDRRPRFTIEQRRQRQRSKPNRRPLQHLSS